MTIEVADRLAPRGMPHWAFWIIVAIVSFVSGEVLLSLFGERRFLTTRLLFAIGYATYPTVVTWAHSAFASAMQGMSSVLWRENCEFISWLGATQQRVFTLRSSAAKAVVFAVTAAAIITTVIVGLPFRSALLNSLSLMMLTPFLMICSQISYLLADLLLTLRHVVRRDADVQFYQVPHPAITNLQGYFASLAVLVTIAYGLLVLAAWNGPYGLSPVMLVWLSVLAFFPFSMFTWSSYQIHILMHQVREKNLAIADTLVQTALLDAQSNPNAGSLEELRAYPNRPLAR